MSTKDANPYLRMTRQERLEFSGEFNHKLAELRKSMCLSWRELGEKIGRQPSQIAKMERNECRITPAVAFALASIFSVDVNELFGMPSMEEMRTLSEGLITESFIDWEIDYDYLSLSVPERANYQFAHRNFRKIRDEAGLSLSEAAKATGYPFHAWNHWEAQTSIPSMSQCFYLASFFGISVNRLLGIPESSELLSRSQESGRRRPVGKPAKELIGQWADVLGIGECRLACEIDELAATHAETGFKTAPQRENLFRPYLLTPPETVKVVFLSDSVTSKYPDGLAFSAKDLAATLATKPEELGGVHFEYQHTQSLRRLYSDYMTCLKLPEPCTNDLAAWAERGVLLLNLHFVKMMDLREKERQPCMRQAPHFTRTVLEYLSSQTQPTVFVLFGRRAHKERSHVEFDGSRNNRVLLVPGLYKATPSALFLHINELLLDMGSSPIDWAL